MHNNDVFSVAAYFIMSSIGMLIMLGGTVIIIVAVWRFMKAHESIAQSLQLLAMNINRDNAGSEKDPVLKDI